MAFKSCVSSLGDEYSSFSDLRLLLIIGSLLRESSKTDSVSCMIDPLVNIPDFKPEVVILSPTLGFSENVIPV